MSELRFASPPPPEDQRRCLRYALSAVIDGWRPLATGVLGESDRIDWIGRDGEGRAVVALLAEGGDDLSLVARGVAQRAWVAARLHDWSQLAPEAGLRPDLEVRLVLVAPAFRPAALAAARVLTDSVLCVTLRFVAGEGSVSPLLDCVSPERPPREMPEVTPSPASFRSGLSDADLDLTSEERAEFDDEPAPERCRPGP